MMLAPRYWNARFVRWPSVREAVAGYSLLVPVPGDLPVFLELALATCELQETQHRRETIVLPDRPSRQIDAIVERHSGTWDGDLRLQRLPMPERVGLPLLRNPSHNHGIQIITGVGSARASHVVLHDADLFLLRVDALDRHYEHTARHGLAVCGVDPVWDTWFADRGFELAATWEMCAARDWMRAFPPAMHMGHTAEILGQEHVFDTTLHPQALTEPARIAVRADPEGIVHFNYVISTYRHFQRSSGSFIDEHFRLLLVRLFVDLFAMMPFDYRLPTLDELARGLRQDGARVVYPTPTGQTVAEYRSFRQKVDRILAGRWTSPARRESAESALTPFDRHFG